MKRMSVEFGASYYIINPEDALRRRYDFTADALVDIDGNYGVPSRGDCTSIRRDVLLPDWVMPSETGGLLPWRMARPGYKSKSGSVDMCFVVCKDPAKQETAYFGEVDQMALIERSLSSGLVFWYPEADGSMASMPVELA